MESCIRISLSEYIDPDQSQRFDHSGRNEIWREPFPPARTCDKDLQCGLREGQFITSKDPRPGGGPTRARTHKIQFKFLFLYRPVVLLKESGPQNSAVAKWRQQASLFWWHVELMLAVTDPCSLSGCVTPDRFAFNSLPKICASGSCGHGSPPSAAGRRRDHKQ